MHYKLCVERRWPQSSSPPPKNPFFNSPRITTRRTAPQVTPTMILILTSSSLSSSSLRYSTHPVSFSAHDVFPPAGPGELTPGAELQMGEVVSAATEWRLAEGCVELNISLREENTGRDVEEVNVSKWFSLLQAAWSSVTLGVRLSDANHVGVGATSTSTLLLCSSGACVSALGAPVPKSDGIEDCTWLTNQVNWDPSSTGFQRRLAATESRKIVDLMTSGTEGFSDAAEVGPSSSTVSATVLKLFETCKSDTSDDAIFSELVDVG